MIIRTTPYLTIVGISHPFLIALTKFAVINGIKHSITTSRLTRIGVIIDVFLYSLMHFANSFITFCQSFLKKKYCLPGGFA
jgi:hypothetical protein